MNAKEVIISNLIMHRELLDCIIGDLEKRRHLGPVDYRLCAATAKRMEQGLRHLRERAAIELLKEKIWQSHFFHFPPEAGN